MRSAKTSGHPPLYDVLMTLKEDVFQTLRVCVPGTIKVVNSDGTVDVEVALLRKDMLGVSTPYPLLPGCPVYTAQGGGVAAAFPIAVNDRCLAVFSDRGLDNWRSSGTPQPLPNSRMHDLSDGFVLVGLNSLNARLKRPIGEGGICEANAAGTGAQVFVDPTLHKVAVRNDTKSLLTILQALITQINAITTSGGQTISGPSQTLLSAVSTELALLLKP